MDQSEIDRLQTEFDIEFPDDYARVLRAYPLHEPTEELLESYDMLRESNAEIRKEGFWGVDVPNSFWLIGLDGMGGGDFINCDGAQTYVYIFDHATPPKDMSDMGQLRPRPFAEHIQALIADEEEFRAEEVLRRSRLEQAVAERKWWQFWVPKKL
jgi:hypothetical protein